MLDLLLLLRNGIGFLEQGLSDKLDTTTQASVVTVLGAQRVGEIMEVLLKFRYVGPCYNAMKEQLLSARELRFAFLSL